MKVKYIFISLGILIFAAVAIILGNHLIQSSLNKNSEQKNTQSSLSSSSEVKDNHKKVEKKENLAIKTALHDFSSLEEFNAQFAPDEDNLTAISTPDEQWMIPDLSDSGSNDGGKTHGWVGAKTKEQAKDTDVTDTKTGKVVYTFKVSDGASAGDIRKALAERDKENK